MANKPKWQKPTDQDIRVAEELINAGRGMAQREIDELKAKLEAAPWLYERAGMIKGFNFTEAQARFFKLILLKQVKESKEYREKYGMTWEEFCSYIWPEISRRWIDEQLADLKPFKAEFLQRLVQIAGCELHKIKYLGESISDQSTEIKDNAIVYQGEVIPLTPEHKDDIQAFLEKLEESYKKQIEEKDAIIKVKDKLIKAKEDLIHKQEKEISRYERNAHDKGLTLEEDAFLQKMENIRISFDGYILKVDPERMEDLKESSTPTKRMIAAYISTLQYMKMQINAAYDTAVDMYGDPQMLPEEAWPGFEKYGIGK